jgi:hypothetical protein
MRLFGRTKQTVGLDIGSGLVKAAVVEHGSRGPSSRASSSRRSPTTRSSKVR